MALKTFMDEPPTLNLTSLIDVIFMLIIFFMVGTQFTEMERKIGLQVPQVADHGALTAAPEKRVVNVYRDGTLTLDQEPITLEQLTARLAAARGEYAELGVLIRGDGEGPYQNVAAVLNACKHAGISQLAVSVHPVTIKR
ncbi:MAG TPA: biopolymer transporter ExbD [Thermoguttaceae bacterium]|nr:biopolymer transporter ExbD [Thermoguttaceae bacterium]